ncbi:MAG: hypothetical protein LAT64_00015 [Phycisphaerales bacterium]|nr:hypothetical protein [Planctomycetota bacterium]MCH8507146.1 hypothetical protein [Phycisphaerales bacterium]
MSSSRDGELTDIEKSWLVAIDALLTQNTANAHAMAAGRMVDLWETGGAAFRHQLGERAAAWLRRHSQLTKMMADTTGPCHRLIELMERPDRTPERPKRPRRGPSRPVRPSHRGHCHRGRIRDAEVEKFMALIDEEGISVVFDPGVSVTTDDVLFKPPLITLDGVGVFHEQIAPVYQRGDIERVWDPVERAPAIALAMDLALLAISREKKWTWVICDRHFQRLPWGHPCKAGPEGRPGWKVVTGALEAAGLIGRRRGQTWRLTLAGKQAAERALAVWRPQ